MEKYYRQRYSYFTRYDQGIQIIDNESWFSVTPELIARKIAEKSCSKASIIIDGFCGIGGNAIQFALAFRDNPNDNTFEEKKKKRVIAIDIRVDYIEQARNNARVYGVEDEILFICGDYYSTLQDLFENGHAINNLEPLSQYGNSVAAFLSPPWGGPDYSNSDIYSIGSLLPVDGWQLMEYTRLFTLNIVLFLPRNTDIQELIGLSCGDDYEEQYPFVIDQHYLNGQYKAITVYYGSLLVDTIISNTNNK